MKRKQMLVIVSVLFVIVLVLLLNGCSAKVTDEDQTESNANKGVETSAAFKAGNCDDCHAMVPAVETWKLTSHSNLPCTACHGEEVSNVSDITPSLPIEIADEVKSENCKQCHSTERKIKTSGDLIIHHEKHDKAGINCVQCHSGVAHAHLAEWEIANQKITDDYPQWDAKMAEEVVANYNQLNMWSCIGCHKEKEITTECSACHSGIDGLPSHEVNEWEVIHGDKGRENIDECISCHSIPGEEKFIKPSTGDEIADFARANQFCYECHLKKPGSHNESMLTNHTSQNR